MRNLLIFLLALLAIWWVRRALTNHKGKGGRPGPEAGGPSDSPERMLECAHCKINVPETEGVHENGRFYCCDAHRRAGPRAD